LADENLPPEEAAKRSVGRLIGSLVSWSVVIVLLGSWVYFLGGYFQLKAGQAAVLLLFGKHERTIEQAGPHFWVPMPFGDYIVIDADNELILDFGFRGKEDETTPREEVLEATMQTGDNNIVRVAFSVRYEIEDAYQAHFKVEDQKRRPAGCSRSISTITRRAWT
jgi:regulator of protease activity HflC (stomatin/prohibitin superfamily)